MDYIWTIRCVRPNGHFENIQLQCETYKEVMDCFKGFHLGTFKPVFIVKVQTLDGKEVKYVPQSR